MHSETIAQPRHALQVELQSTGSVVELELSSAPLLLSLVLDDSELELVSLLVAPVLSLVPDDGLLSDSSKHAATKSELSARRRIAAE